jgi:hypothetical protein
VVPFIELGTNVQQNSGASQKESGPGSVDMRHPHPPHWREFIRAKAELSLAVCVKPLYVRRRVPASATFLSPFFFFSSWHDDTSTQLTTDFLSVIIIFLLLHPSIRPSFPFPYCTFLVITIGFRSEIIQTGRWNISNKHDGAWSSTHLLVLATTFILIP